MSSRGLSELVAAAAVGDEAAWNALVDRFAGLVWAVARSHRLGASDAGDVSQTTWLRLVENLDRLRDPERVGAWLATTARRESLRVLQRRGHETPLPDDGDWPDSDLPELDRALLADERDSALRRAIAVLPERCQALLRLLFTEPEPSYDEISAALGIPIGSIGPTRQRCLERLRRNPALAALSGGASGSSETRQRG